MDTAQIKNRNLEAIAWGAIFVWWGVTELLPSLPRGTGALGIGLILIGLNVARALIRTRISVFTTSIGIVALAWGAVELARPALHLTFDFPVFAVLLIVFGAFLMGSVIRRPSAAA